MVERRGARRNRCGGHAIRLHRSAEAREAAVRPSDHFAAEDHASILIGTAACMLTGKAPPRGKCADQGHFTILVFLQPKHASQRLARDLVRVDPE